MSKRLSKTLLKHRSDEDEWVTRFCENEDLLNIIISALEDKINESLTKQRQITNYSSPNWAYAQVDSIATQRTLQEIIDLLTLKE